MAISFEVADGQVFGDVLRDPNIAQALLKLYQGINTGPMSGIPVSMAYILWLIAMGRCFRKVYENYWINISARLRSQRLHSNTTCFKGPTQWQDADWAIHVPPHTPRYT